MSLNTDNHHLDIGANLVRAVRVIKESYRNIRKLLMELDIEADKAGFNPITEKHLRWFSDTQTDGWVISDFIKLYTVDGDAENDTAVVYGVEVSLDEVDSAKLIIAKYEYESSANPNDWKLSVSDHWLFNHPVQGYKDRFKSEKSTTPDVSIRVPSSDKVKSQYRNLKHVSFKKMDLTEVKHAEDLRRVFAALTKLNTEF